jgi:hypothetical protein
LTLTISTFAQRPIHQEPLTFGDGLLSPNGKMVFDLTEESFLMYAIKNYDNPNCRGMHEFHEDLKRIKYIKRLLGRYRAGKGLKERLLLNHIIVLNNLFGPEAIVKILFFKLEKKYWSELKTFLLFLNIMPPNVTLYDNIHETQIPVDMHIANILRKI